MEDNGDDSLSLEFVIPKKGIAEIAGNNRIKDLFNVTVILGKVFSKGQGDVQQWVRVSGDQAANAKVSHLIFICP